ncbi:regulatory protein RecX [Roseivirga sp. BDSF3-8]|uniref:regulatory protein RecX n=1 Tax=Roseivirga sp. BDSF3-8 TaxID=3241598 RepID=UPI0035320668
MSKAEENHNKIIAQLCDRMASYCAYRERSPREVFDKIKKEGVSQEVAEEVVEKLRDEGFLNEERFASAFVHDKFRLQKWGRIKIRQHLRAHKVEPTVLETSLYNATPDEAYEELLNELLIKKAATLKGQPALQKKQKVTRFLLQRGFENELIREAMDNHLP